MREDAAFKALQSVMRLGVTKRRTGEFLLKDARVPVDGSLYRCLKIFSSTFATCQSYIGWDLVNSTWEVHPSATLDIVFSVTNSIFPAQY